MKIRWRSGVWILARLAAGGVLAYAGWTKLTEPSVVFETALLKYGVLSPALIPWVSRVLPWAEWIAGCFLITGYAPRLAAGGASLLFLTFLVTLTSSPLFLQSGGSDCGCFGHSGLHLTLQQIFFVDLAGLAISLRLAFEPSAPGSIDSFLLKRWKPQADIQMKLKG